MSTMAQTWAIETLFPDDPHWQNLCSEVVISPKRSTACVYCKSSKPDRLMVTAGNFAWLALTLDRTGKPFK